MEKLYKSISGVLHYQEAWFEDGLFYHHWGRVGEIGEHTSTPAGTRPNKKRMIRAALAPAMADGYSPININDHVVLLIEFAVEDLGTNEDLVKRYALEHRMNETLG